MTLTYHKRCVEGKGNKKNKWSDGFRGWHDNRSQEDYRIKLHFEEINCVKLWATGCNYVGISVFHEYWNSNFDIIIP